MRTLNQSFILIILGSFISYFPVNSRLLIKVYENHNKKVLSSFLFQGDRQNPEGFKAVTRIGNEFIASGTNGRIDRISASGSIIKSEKYYGEKFNCILSDNMIVITAGDRGTIYISSEKGVFYKIDSNSKENINSLALFKGKIIAGSDHGEILSGDLKGSFKRTKLAVRET